MDQMLIGLETTVCDLDDVICTAETTEEPLGQCEACIRVDRGRYFSYQFKEVSISHGQQRTFSFPWWQT